MGEYTLHYISTTILKFFFGQKARSKRLRKFKILGEVKDFVWTGNLREGLLWQFNEDIHIKDELIRLRYNAKIKCLSGYQLLAD
jgi:hypothetical protein